MFEQNQKERVFVRAEIYVKRKRHHKNKTDLIFEHQILMQKFENFLTQFFGQNRAYRNYQFILANLGFQKFSSNEHEFVKQHKYHFIVINLQLIKLILLISLVVRVLSCILLYLLVFLDEYNLPNVSHSYFLMYQFLK